MAEPELSPDEPENDVRPVIRTVNPGNRQVWVFGAFLLIGGAMIFQGLASRREQVLAPATIAPETGGGFITSPPPLAIAQPYAVPFQYERDTLLLDRPGRYPPRAPLAPAGQQPQQPATAERQSPAPLPAPYIAQPYPTQPTSVVIEPPEIRESDFPRATEPQEERVLARRLANPALTIPQGTIIAAVLETALDSTRPGAARAVVSRDVHSFDGSHVLVPRGSRLYGEYEADVSTGQKRALIRWMRLTRPDAVIVQLDSPAADPLGRAGVEGEVDSKFFARFGAAILQSVLDIGVGVAVRRASDGVILALPGSTQQITGIQQQNPVQPTLRVRQGTSVSVFVARDLDFSDVDG